MDTRIGQERLAGCLGRFVAAVHRYDDSQLGTALAQHRLERLGYVLGAAPHRNGDAYPGRAWCHGATIRSAQTPAKYGVIVSFPGSTE